MYRGGTRGASGGGDGSGSGSSTARLAAVVVGNKLSEGNVSRTASRARACRRKNPKVSRARATMTRLRFKPLCVLRSEICLYGLTVAVAMAVIVRRPRVTIFPAGLEQDAAGLGAIGWRRSQRSDHGCQAPLLDIGLDKDKASLSKVDMYSCGPVGAYGGKEIRILDAMYNVVQLLAVAGEEYATRSWPVTAADDIALHELGRIRCLVEGLVEALEAVGKISSRVSMKACHMNHQYSSLLSKVEDDRIRHTWQPE